MNEYNVVRCARKQRTPMRTHTHTRRSARTHKLPIGKVEYVQFSTSSSHVPYSRIRDVYVSMCVLVVCATLSHTRNARSHEKPFQTQVSPLSEQTHGAHSLLTMRTLQQNTKEIQTPSPACSLSLLRELSLSALVLASRVAVANTDADVSLAWWCGDAVLPLVSRSCRTLGAPFANLKSEIVALCVCVRVATTVCTPQQRSSVSQAWCMRACVRENACIVVVYLVGVSRQRDNPTTHSPRHTPTLVSIHSHNPLCQPTCTSHI